MNRLLNRTLLFYTFFATLILLLSSPFFYLMMEKLYIDDVDEAIWLRKKEFLIKSRPTLKVSDIVVWNRFNRDTRILPDTIDFKNREHIIQQLFFDEMTPEWEPYRVLYTKVVIEDRSYILMIRLNLVESEDLIKTLSWLYFGVLFTLLLVILLLTRYISNRLWKPFYRTIEQIKEFNLEQHRLPVFSKTEIVEFKQLNTSLNELIKSNLSSYETQKEFTANAAHELQTPLAVFQSKLDMLLQEPALNKTQADILQSLYEASSRLSRVNRNLLLLAKIENNQYSIFESIDIKNLINEVLPYFKEQASSRQLSITTDIDDSPVLNAPRALVEIMINNLILNAISHNVMNGDISITVTKKCITVCNTSDQPKLDNHNLFKRFGKISHASQSTGLGLAIIKQICERNNLVIKYEYRSERHCFSIHF